MRSLGFVLLFPVGMATARLYHVPLGVGGDEHEEQRRRLAGTGFTLDPSEVDLDALYQARGVQYADLKVGCPAQDQSAIISTASSAIGFPCSGCTHDCGEGHHLNGLYQQQLSTCFKDVACGDCQLSSYSCTAKQCPVHLRYAEGSSWAGIEVEDMVSVGGEDADEASFPLRFGCQKDITGLFETQIPDGIFGMSKEKGSAISQWSDVGYLDYSAFSLCYNVREDVKTKSGVMVLGGSDPRLHDKPMVFAKDVGSKYYEIRIKNVSLKRGPGLSVPVHASTNNDTGIVSKLDLESTTAILDSATTCSYLPREWHEPLKEAWRQTTGGKYSMFRRLNIKDDEINELPTIVFEVEGTHNNTITLEYPPIRYMEKSEYGTGWDFCLYAEERTSGSVELGNTFMAGHDVLHDLEKQRIGFAESTCQPSIVQVSVTSDADAADKQTATNDRGNGDSQLEQPPHMTPSDDDHTADTDTLQQPTIGITSDGNTTEDALPPFTNLKAVVLQSDPHHERKSIDPTAVGFDIMYALLALGVFVVAFALYRKRRSLTFWNEPSTKHAYQLSLVSLVATLFAIAAGAGLFSSTGSSLFLVLALESCVDFLSSAVVLWRFFAPSDVTEKLELKLQNREKRADVAISMILVVLGISVWITAIQDLLRGQEEQDPNHQKTALVISFFSFLVFGVLTWFKFRYAKVLRSPSLHKDGFCSLIGVSLSASLFINTLVIKLAPSVWMIDPIVAILCGLVSLLYGLKAIHEARSQDPVFALRWWFEDPTMANDGDGSREGCDKPDDASPHHFA